MTLLGPDGVPTRQGGEVCGNIGGGVMGIDETIQEAGMHTIVVWGGIGEGARLYSLLLDRVFPPSLTSSPLSALVAILKRNVTVLQILRSIL
jgi:hypothetical protein